MSKFRVGDTAYIVESNNLVREVTIKRCSGGFYLVQFENSGGIKVREKRLFQTKEDAIAFIRRMGHSPREEHSDNIATPQTTHRGVPLNLQSAAAMYHSREK